MRRVSLDIESTGLLDSTGLDYTKMPYRLKDSYSVHCIVVQDIDTEEVFVFLNEGFNTPELQDLRVYGNLPKSVRFFPLGRFLGFIKKCCQVIAHNGLGFDYPLLSLWFDKEYQIGKDGLAFPNGEWLSREDHLFDSWGGRDINFEDSLLLSKLLNPDRFGGHSLEDWGKRSGLEKINIVSYAENNLNLWLDDEQISEFYEYENQANKTDRKKLLKTIYFSEPTNHLIFYCIIDTVLCTKVWKKLQEEKAGWDWEQAYNTELMTADIIFTQEHVGFKYDQELARRNYKELTGYLKGIEGRVEPRLPGRGLTQKETDTYTPPKGQVKQDLTMTSGMGKWLDKMGATILEERSWEKGKRVIKTLTAPTKVLLLGEERSFPLDKSCIRKTLPMKISDHIPLKEHIVSLGWHPIVWAETDLTLDSKKRKRDREGFDKCIAGYLSKKVFSPFLPFVLKHQRVKTFEELVAKFRKHKLNKPLKVYTSPKYTIDSEKTLDPSLLRLGSSVDYVADVVLWLTYTHRRNSIFSSKENSESKDENSGWSSHARLAVDGRMPTPADTMGCNTSRFQHKGVANVPRVTSLYGEPMRRLFGVDKEVDYQVGYDADGLEARVEAHYCLPYDQDGYCESLAAAKPNDLHSLRAAAKGMERDDSKTMKYSITYGATYIRVAAQFGWSNARAKAEVESFWEDAVPLAKYLEVLTDYWLTTGGKKFIIGIDGRKVMTRSQHSLGNSSFQSAGVIAMKIAMIWADRYLRRSNFIGDPFKEDIYDRPTTSQQIAYHDEAQNRISKSLVKWKKFSSKEESTGFSKDPESLAGEVVHKGGYWWVPVSGIATLLSRSVGEGGKYLGINVDLTAAWNVGYNWAECH